MSGASSRVFRVRLVVVRGLPTAWRTLLAGLLSAGGLARADTTVVTARAEAVTNQFQAYAQVEPIAALPVRAAQTGLITGLKTVPGASVQAGQKLAKLGGPEIQSALTQVEAAMHSARTNVLAAEQILAIDKRQLASHLVTRQALLQAESAAAQARAALDSAQARRRALRQTITLKAPAAGIVLAVTAADGQRVAAGDTILTVQPADQLWLKASYYGADSEAIHAGMSGQFLPAAGGKPVPVKVATVFGALSPDGAESVGLLAATPGPGWLNGQFGTVTLTGPIRQLVAVPTRALILDEGRWWVLVHTAHGNQRQAVTPGPTRGWQTFIKSGLEPGAEVVAENAYLEFHHAISRNYLPPD